MSVLKPSLGGNHTTRTGALNAQDVIDGTVELAVDASEARARNEAPNDSVLKKLEALVEYSRAVSHIHLAGSPSSKTLT